jgi:hypothetical protein
MIYSQDASGSGEEGGEGEEGEAAAIEQIPEGQLRPCSEQELDWAQRLLLTAQSTQPKKKKK